MECDVAVLGGGPGGYTAAIRAAQLGAKTVCVELEPELGGTCLRVGCIPTKAWVQTAHAMHQAGETFAKFGVEVSRPQLELRPGRRVEERRRQADDRWGRQPLQGERRRVGEGPRPLHAAPNTLAVEGGEDVQFKSAIVATGSFPLRPPIDGIDSPRCVDSTGLLAQTEVPRRLVVLGGGIIGCEFASIFQRFGSEVTIVEMLDTLIPQEDADAAKELAKQFGKRGIALQLGKQCNARRRRGAPAARALRRGRERRDRPDARLDRARPARRGARARGDRRPARPPRRDRDRRAPADDGAAHLRRRRLRRLLAARAHRLPRGRGRGGERLRPRGDDRRPRRAAADLHRSGDRRRRPDRGAGARAVRRRRRGRRVPVGRERACRDAGRDGRLGQVDPRDEVRRAARPRHGRPARDRPDRGRHGRDRRGGDGRDGRRRDGAHPTLSEAIKEAGLVALGRAIHLPNRKRAPAQT